MWGNGIFPIENDKIKCINCSYEGNLKEFKAKRYNCYAQIIVNIIAFDEKDAEGEFEILRKEDFDLYFDSSQEIKLIEVLEEKEKNELLSSEDLKKRISELERLVKIHETFFKEQYEYDKKLIMERFGKIEKKLKIKKISPECKRISKAQIEVSEKLIIYVLNGYIDKDDLPYVNIVFSLSESKIEEEKEKWVKNLNHVIQCENSECKKDTPDLRDKDWDQEICPKCEDPKRSTVEWDQYEEFRIEKIEIDRESEKKK